MRWDLAGPRYGPLPIFLLALTLVTGLVDAVSVLRLGRVFVANMTGNIVFSGFALAGAPGFSLVASLVALAGFLLGAGAGGPLIGRLASDRARLLQVAAGIELVLLGVATLVMAEGPPTGSFATYVVAALLAPAMGLQNSVARKLAVPDYTTTVLTMTLTGIAADVRAGQGAAAVVRRLTTILAMAVGAIVGAILVLRGAPWSSLALAALLAAFVTVGLGVVIRPGQAWRAP